MPSLCSKNRRSGSRGEGIVEKEKVPKARLCALGFQDPRQTTHPTSSPTPDGESAILQWAVNEGHLLESGDHLLESGNLKTAFLSGHTDPAHNGSDAFVTLTHRRISVKSVSSVDVSTKLRTAVAASSVSPATENRKDR